MKHFNKAVISGAIHEFTRKTSEGGKYYLEIQVNCPFPKYGNVRVFARLWGEEKVEQFMKDFKPKYLVRLTGVMQQYKNKEGKTYTNFSVYKAEPWSPADDQHGHKRATFILAGEVNAYDDQGDGGRLFLRVKIEQKDGYSSDEVLEAFVPSSISLDFGAEFPAGTEVRVKGVIAQEEDEFGEVVVHSRPVAATVARAGKEEETPF